MLIAGLLCGVFVGHAQSARHERMRVLLPKSEQG
jgi:hypothetical protein